MAIKTVPWDSAAALRNDAEIAAYLDAALEEALASDDHAILTHALGVVARAKGMSDLAQSAGMGREHLYKALSDEGNPTLSTVLRVMKALKVTLHVTPIAPELA